MLSILVTYYNQEKFVSRSLNSIFNQNLKEEFEVLIGDDGSCDNTCKIVEEYQKKYPGKIKLFIQERDFNKKYNPVERASKNRLDLLNNAKGNYVCFLDGDDEYCDFNWLQESINILSKDKTLVGVAHNYYEKYDDGKIIKPEGIKGYNYITAKLYARKLYTHVGTILFRNCFSKNDYAFLRELKSFDDNDITFYFLNFGNLYCVDIIVYNYYQNENSIWNSSNDVEKNLINAIDYEILKKILKKFHLQLFYKYFDSYKNVYKNRNLLYQDRYSKYKKQCITNGKIEILMSWKLISQFRKLIIHIHFINLQILIFILKIITKIKNLF